MLGAFAEYLGKGYGPQELIAERKKQLRMISEIRGRSVLVIASDLTKAAPKSIDYSDILPVSDLVETLPGPAIDIILETPGGSGEVAEDIIKLLRQKYEQIAFIVPGWAKSAGTIMVMAGDEILMEPASALGPIDAQIVQGGGKAFSADALLTALEKIKKEVDETGRLNPTYVPILSQISPGEIQHYENALSFARQLVSKWLAQYKFRNWTTHSSSGEPVTEECRLKRAQEIAEHLCNHNFWLTHSRSVKMDDLRAMKLHITDYSETPALHDAIRRYHILMRMTFESNVYKMFETPVAQIYRMVNPAPPVPNPTAQKGADADLAVAGFTCPKCGLEMELGAVLAPSAKLEPHQIPFPRDNHLVCPQCGATHNLTAARQQIEQATGKKIM